MYGLKGSPTQVERIFNPEKSEDRETITGSSVEIAEELYKRMREYKFAQEVKMGQLHINHDKVDHKLMRELIELCPFNAIEESNGKLDINAGCKMCRLCVKQGKGAIELLEDTD